MKGIAQFLALLMWVGGIVIAQGFWSTFFAVIVPIWGWYLVVERALTHYGILGLS